MNDNLPPQQSVNDTGPNPEETPVTGSIAAPVMPVKTRDPGQTVIIILLGLILIGIVLGFGVILYYQSTHNKNGNTAATPTPGVTETVTLTATAAPAAPGVSITPTGSSTADRVRITSPLPNQIIPAAGGNIVLAGQIKDFFEGTMGYRLLGGNGGVLISGSVTAPDNYGRFADFTKTVAVPPIPSTAGNPGKWEFFETSMKDGSETVLLSLPVEFE
jgi:hypothetical protein